MTITLLKIQDTNPYIQTLFMKKLLLYYISGPLLLGLAACSKTTVPAGTASLTLINAVVGSKPLVSNFSDRDSITYYYNAMQVLYNVFNPLNQVNSYSGIQHIRLYQYPDTGVKASPLYDLTLDLPVGSIHTLFLTGTVSQPDSLFTTDMLPYHPVQDSSLSVRFVNLSPGSAPVSIDLAGQPNGSEAASLPYKGISSFIDYPANAATASYTFEFRDKTTGALLGTYTMPGLDNNSGSNFMNNKWRYRNFTLALIGIPGGTGNSAQKILLIIN